MEPDPALPRACVVGVGSSGLAAAKALHEARVPFVCYEPGPVVGGNGVYDNPNGQSACYDTLEINTSCPRMAFSDYPMPQEYPAYAAHHQVASYFESYADHFGFRDRIVFGTTVDAVERDGDGWAVTVTGPQGTRTESYDAVLVTNGHHWDPRWPEPGYPGTLDGEQMHAHDYRGGDQLAGRDVVVGADNSAMDIAVVAANRARTATISQRRGEWVLRKFLLGRPTDQIALPSWLPWWCTAARLSLGARLSGDTSKLGLPRPEHKPGQSHPVQSEGIREVLRTGELTPKPGIARLDGDRVVFVDGTSAPCDLLVWATGYRVSFPFFDDSLLDVGDNELPLFKRAVHPDLPGLFFIGLLQPVGAVMPLAEAQSRWVAQLLRGDYALPDVAEMRRTTTADHERYKKRFYRSARHTMEVDFDHFLWDLAREQRAGAERAKGRRVRCPAASPRSEAGSGRVGSGQVG